jgi:5-hydroxyisourate hydrolase
LTEGRLTTHVLDTARGCPASFMRVDFRRLDGTPATLTLDTGGRAVLLEGEAFLPGDYEISFHAGDYQQHYGAAAFFTVIPIRFTITDASQHYHIPLVLSPYGYSTYRGG